MVSKVISPAPFVFTGVLPFEYIFPIALCFYTLSLWRGRSECGRQIWSDCEVQFWTNQLNVEAKTSLENYAKIEEVTRETLHCF